MLAARGVLGPLGEISRRLIISPLVIHTQFYVSSRPPPRCSPRPHHLGPMLSWCVYTEYSVCASVHRPEGVMLPFSRNSAPAQNWIIT